MRGGDAGNRSQSPSCEIQDLDTAASEERVWDKNVEVSWWPFHFFIPKPQTYINTHNFTCFYSQGDTHTYPRSTLPRIQSSMALSWVYITCSDHSIAMKDLIYRKKVKITPNLWCFAKENLHVMWAGRSWSWEGTGTVYKCLTISRGWGTWGFSAGRPGGNRNTVERSKERGDIEVTLQEVLPCQELCFASDVCQRETHWKHKVH